MLLSNDLIYDIINTKHNIKLEQNNIILTKIDNVNENTFLNLDLNDFNFPLVLVLNLDISDCEIFLDSIKIDNYSSIIVKSRLLQLVIKFKTNFIIFKSIDLNIVAYTDINKLCTIDNIRYYIKTTKISKIDNQNEWNLYNKINDLNYPPIININGNDNSNNSNNSNNYNNYNNYNNCNNCNNCNDVIIELIKNYDNIIDRYNIINDTFSSDSIFNFIHYNSSTESLIMLNNIMNYLLTIKTDNDNVINFINNINKNVSYIIKNINSINKNSLIEESDIVKMKIISYFKSET